MRCLGWTPGTARPLEPSTHHPQCKNCRNSSILIELRLVSDCTHDQAAPAQPCFGFQPAGGIALIIQGTPNLSTREPYPGDQKVSLNGMIARPPADS